MRKIHLAGSAVPDMPPSYTAVFDIARLIQGARNRPGPPVINVSLGPAEESPASYALFFYELYEMLTVLSPETRDRITVVVSAGNDGIALGAAIAAARSAEVDPEASKHVLIAGGPSTSTLRTTRPTCCARPRTARTLRSPRATTPALWRAPRSRRRSSLASWRVSPPTRNTRSSGARAGSTPCRTPPAVRAARPAALDHSVATRPRRANFATSSAATAAANVAGCDIAQP